MGREAKYSTGIRKGLKADGAADPKQLATKAEVRLARAAIREMFAVNLALLGLAIDALPAALGAQLETAKANFTNIAAHVDKIYADVEAAAPETR